MREDLKTACRSLSFTQRFLLREQLHRTKPLLDAAETVQILAPGWWRGHRSLAVVTSCRLLLIRPELTDATVKHASFPFRIITHLTVHAHPAEGARFRLAVGLDLEEFSITQDSEQIKRALLAATS